MSDAAVSPAWSPTSPQSRPWTPPSPDRPRSPAWTEYTLRSPLSSVFSPTAGDDGTPPHDAWTRLTSHFRSLHAVTTLQPPPPASPWTPQDRLKAKARARRRRKAKAKAKAKAQAEAPAKTSNKRGLPGYDQKTFAPLNLKALQTKTYEAKDLRRLDIEIEVPPITYLDSCGRTQTNKVGRRGKKYTRWLPDNGEGFMFGEEEKRRAIERVKKWRAEQGWGDLVGNEDTGKGKEAITTDAIVIPAAATRATKRKLGDFEDLPDCKTPTDVAFRGVSHADDAPPSAKRVLRDFTSSCMDGRTIRVYQECSGDPQTRRSFAQRYPGLTYDTVVQRKTGRPETQMADNGENADGNERKTERPTENVIPSTPDAFAIAAPQPATSASASSTTSVADPPNDDFTIHTTSTTLITKESPASGSSEDNLAFTPSNLTLASCSSDLLPHLTKHQRRKLRKRLGIHPPTNTNRRRRDRISTTNGYHGGNTPKGSPGASPTGPSLDKPRRRPPRRGIPDQPRGPKKSRHFDCRDRVLGNCPPDCAGRLHKRNGKVEQSTKARSTGVLVFGRGVGVGEWVSGEVVGRARGVSTSGGGGAERGMGRDWGRK